MLIFAALTEGAPPESSGPWIDEDLLAKIGQGDREAFSRLYEQACGSVYAYALSLLRDREDAQDAMQDVFLKVRGAAHLYIPQGKPLAWLLTITRNVCMMHFRQRRRFVDAPLEEEWKEETFSPIGDREDRLVLEAAFTVLSAEECQIIVLHAVSGMKHREIGALLQLPLSTVLSKYNRGIRKLRKRLEEIL